MKSKPKTKSFSMSMRVKHFCGPQPPPETFLPRGSFTVTLDYPLDTNHKFVVKGPMTATQLGIAICQEYGKIYAEDAKDPEKYGIWGHDIGDLYIEGVKVNLLTKRVYVDVGS